MFGWVDFREEGKKKRRENIFCECLVQGRGGKKLVGPDCFLLGPTKIFSLQIGEKLERTKMDRHGKRTKSC